jgi:histidinol phosphatase-like enzyme (inositol monophosphatase family)
VPPLDFPAIARAAESAADAARREILPRFRSVAVSTKADGSPVTEADTAGERAIRARLREAFPAFAIQGEEYGREGPADSPVWLVDPIDGTIAFSRGIPLFATLIALVDAGEPVFGLIDLPGLGERTLGWRGGGAWRDGKACRVSTESDLRRAIVSHGDPFCFEQWGAREAFLRMAREIPLLRGYTDAFGHAQVVGGGIGAMVDLELYPWDAAPAQVLVPEAGGRCVTLAGPGGKLGLVLGSPALVEQLEAFLERA